MPLPVTRAELNRLGARLVASESPSDADLKELAIVLAAYQEVLERVKADLRSVGFAPAGRVKTTKTMIEKLRRMRGMELGRVQDLAGARIVLRDLGAQDEASEKISGLYAAEGCARRVVDRRKDPRFGYKAVHLIISVDGVPVEIQVRTELQDTWAQIFERLADRWGRGIRYGEDPVSSESIVRSGDLVTSRIEVVASMMVLSDVISEVEQYRAIVARNKESVDGLADVMARGKEDPRYSGTSAQERLASKIPAEMLPIQERFAQVLARSPEGLDPEGQALLEAGADITGAQLVRLTEIANSLDAQMVSAQVAELRHHEHELRDMLQLVAGATDEGP